MGSMRTEALAVALLVACSSADEPEAGPLDVQVAVAEHMPTVIEVSWRTEAPTRGHVAFGTGALDRHTLEGPEGTEHSAVLVGLPPDTDVSVQVVADGVSGAEEIVRTGALAGAPSMTVEGASDRFAALPIVGEVSSAAVLDPQGRVVWWHSDPREPSVFRVRVARDGRGVVYSATVLGGNPHEGSAFVRVPWTGGSEEVLEVPWLAHDFVEHDDGTLVSLAYTWQGEVEGNKLVRVHPDGTTEDLWDTWDCFDPALHTSIDPAHGWTHANALDYDAARDVYLVGLRNLQTIVQVDVETRSCDWAFGGSGGTVEIDGPTFLHQHQFTRTEAGLLVFDNDGAPGNESRVLEYAFDEGAATATQVDSFRADPALYSFILGDAHRLPGGDTAVVWSVPATVDRYAPDHTRVWRAAADDPDLIFGFAELLADPGHPSSDR